MTTMVKFQTASSRSIIFRNKTSHLNSMANAKRTIWQHEYNVDCIFLHINCFLYLYSILFCVCHSVRFNPHRMLQIKYGTSLFSPANEKLSWQLSQTNDLEMWCVRVWHNVTHPINIIIIESNWCCCSSFVILCCFHFMWTAAKSSLASVVNWLQKYLSAMVVILSNQ